MRNSKEEQWAGSLRRNHLMVMGIWAVLESCRIIWEFVVLSSAYVCSLLTLSSQQVLYQKLRGVLHGFEFVGALGEAVLFLLVDVVAHGHAQRPHFPHDLLALGL